MRGLYNFLFTVFLILSAPFYFLKMWRRGNWREGFGQRFGRYSPKLKQTMTNRHIIWIHAVSVGEVNICTQLIRALEPRVPNLKIVVSTTTSTGMGELNRVLPSHIQKIYYPIDRRAYVRRAMRTIHPEAVVLVEAEIWPNFLWTVGDCGIPLFLVNGRLSDRSYRGYKRFRSLFRPLFQTFHGVGCQNEGDAARFRSLGCRPDRVHVVGNLKFDAAKLGERSLIDVPSVLRQLGVKDGAPILLGGSTHAGEEEVLARVYRNLKSQFPNLFLILAPRHFERGKEVGRYLESHGLTFQYRKSMNSQIQLPEGELDCLLLNTTGELRYFYEHATVIFVGKSLTAEGGQNPIEPGALGKPILFGPNMQNFQAVAKSFVDADGAIQIRNENELQSSVAKLLTQPDMASRLSKNALSVVKQNLGAIERSVDMILAGLAGVDTYKASARQGASASVS